MLQTIYRPGDLASLPVLKRIPVGAGRKSMLVVNRSPFWFIVKASGGDPVEIIMGWDKASFNIPTDTRTFTIEPYELNGAPVVDWSSDLPNMVLVDTSCDAVSSSSHSAIISPMVPLSVSTNAALGSSVTVQDLVPFTGNPSQYDASPAGNPWIVVTGSEAQLQLLQNNTLNPGSPNRLNGFNKQGYMQAVVPTGSFNAGANAGIGNNVPITGSAYGPGDSNFGVEPVDVGTRGNTYNASSYTIKNPLGVDASEFSSLIFGASSLTVSEVSNEVLYLYNGQYLVLWIYLDASGTFGYAGVYDAANPGNGFAVRFVSPAGTTFNNPAIVLANYEGASSFVVPQFGSYDLTNASVEPASNVQPLARTSLNGHSLSRLYIGSAPVSELNPVPVKKYLTRISAKVTSATLGANATFTESTWQDSENPGLSDIYGNPGPSVANYVAGMVYSDQAGTLYLDVTDDTSNANLILSTSVAVTAATATALPKTAVGGRYYRFRYVNGVTAQTTFELTRTIMEE